MQKYAINSRLDITDALKRGLRLRQQGQLHAALEVYQSVVAQANAPMPAFFLLGNTLLDMRHPADALAAFEQALSMAPTFVPALLQKARCWRQLGDGHAARRAYVAVLQLNLGHYSAWLEAGHVSRELADEPYMLACYDKATQASPLRWEPWLALARAHEDAGQWDAAAVACHRALSLAHPEGQPDQTAQIHSLMAKYRLQRGQHAMALDSLRQALMAQRIAGQAGTATDSNQQCELLMDMGEILMRLGLIPEAHRLFERASVATAEATLVRLAELSFRFNLWQEALEVLRRNVQLHPGSANAYWNLAHLCAESWQLEEAHQHLQAAEAIAPQPGAPSMRASTAGRQGDADTALQIYLQLARSADGRSPMASSAAMSSLYSDKLSPQGVRELHRQLFTPWGHGARAIESFGNSRDAERPLRVGLVTSDFHHQHPVNIFMQPVIARLDRSQFEVTVYFTGVSYDEQTRLAQSRVARWVECTTLLDRQLAARIEADHIDILIDLAGHTSRNRQSLFAQRAAPVQVTFLGYPGSTGVPNVDWLLADPVVAPPEHDGLFSERVYRLPNTVFCFHPEDNYPFPDLSVLDRPITFGSFNNTPKLTSHTVGLWSRILKALPESRLVLKAPSFKDAGAIRLFAQRFGEQGIDTSRIEFRGPVGLADMMAEYADIDIALDSVPYNGGTTSLQAMWMGVPVVALEGGQFVSRMTASFMRAAGLDDWVARNDDEYVAIATAMASDRARLNALKRGMRESQLSRPAWHIDKYVADLQVAIRCMWRTHCRSAAPHPRPID
jgi:protein O-GlcNAc transferase